MVGQRTPDCLDAPGLTTLIGVTNMLTIPVTRYSPRDNTKGKPRNKERLGYLQIAVLQLASGHNPDELVPSSWERWKMLQVSRQRDVLYPLIKHGYVTQQQVGNTLNYVVSEDGRTVLNLHLLEQRRRKQLVQRRLKQTTAV